MTDVASYTLHEVAIGKETMNNIYIYNLFYMISSRFAIINLISFVNFVLASGNKSLIIAVIL